MKKISIRSLFIVILALVLVFALVACGNKDDNKGGNTGGGGGGQTTPPNDVTNVKNYFNTLWEKSTGIGGEAIGEKDDLKVSLDLAVALDLVDGNGQGYDTLDLGIALDLVLDRSSGTDNSTNTAIKAKIYDPSNGENWFTAYYFFNDVDNIYIDYAGQNVKIPFSYFNESYNKNFYNFVFNDKIIKDKVDDKGQVTKEGKTLAQIITALTKNMGSSWDLNVLIGDVMKVFDVDVAKFKDTISGVLGMLDGFNVDDAFDAQGNLNIKSILTNDMIAGFFANDETTTVTKGDVTTYTTKLASSTLDMLSLLGDSLPAGLMDVIEGLDLTLQFTTKNDAIDSFTIKVGLPALEGENANVNNVHPVVAITINELDFAKAREGEIENSMAVKRDNYKTEAVIDAEVAVDLKGITLNALAFDKANYARFSKVNEAIKTADPTIKKGLEEIVLDGNLALTLSGKLDLKNEKSKNETAAKAALTYKGVNIVEASFNGGTLAVKVNQEAKIGDVKILDTLVRLFGDYAYNFVKTKFFNGNADDAALKDFVAKFFSCNIEEQVAVNAEGKPVVDPQDRVITINKSFQGAVWKNVDIVGGFQKLVKGVLDKMFPPKTGAGTAVAKDPIITKVADTVVAALPLIKSTNGKLVVATNANKAFKNAYSSVGNTVQTIGKIWWEKNAKPFTETLIEGDKDNWLPVFANALKVAGTTYGEKADAEKVKTFLNEMFACTAELTLDISGTKGIELSVQADVNENAGVGVSVKLGAKAYDENQYKTLAPDVETDAWFVYTFAA